MNIVVQCTSCGKRYNANERVAGKRVRCKHCGAMFDVPSLTGAEGGAGGIGGMPAGGSAAFGGGGGRDGGFDPSSMDPPMLPDGEEQSAVGAAGKVIHPEVAPGSVLTGGYSRMERSGDAEAFDLADDRPLDAGLRPNRPFIYPASPEVDQFLPWALVVGWLGWAAYEIFAWEGDAELWVRLLRCAVYLFLFAVIIFPLANAGLRAGMRRMRVALPSLAPWRALGAFSTAFGLAMILFIVGGDFSSLILGGIVGLILAGSALWILFRLEPREIGAVAGYGAGGFVLGSLLSMGLLSVANMALLSSMRSNGKVTAFVTSPLGATLNWDQPPPPKPLPHRVPPIPPQANPPSTPGAVAVSPDQAPDRSPSAQPPVATAPPEGTANEAATQPMPVPVPVDPALQNNTIFSTSHPAPDGKNAPTRGPAVTHPDENIATIVPVPPAALPAQHPIASTPAGASHEASSIIPASPLIRSIDRAAAVGVYDEALFPGISATHIGIVRSRDVNADVVESWSLDPLKKVGEARFQHEADARDKYVLSPDGQYLVRVVKWPRLMAQVWSFKDQSVAATLDLKSDNGTPSLISFVGPTQFLVQWRRGPNLAMEWLDLKTGQHFPRGSGMLPSVPERDMNGYAISPDGKLVAMPAKADVGQMVLYDPTRGAVIGRRLPITDMDPRYPIEPAGVAFSPDAKKLAVLFERSGNGLLLCWDLTSGKQVAEYTYPGGYGFSTKGGPGQHAQYEGPALDWIGDRAWLLWGRGLFDAATGRLLGEVGLEDVTRQYVVDSRTILLSYSAAGQEARSPAHVAQALAVVHLDPDKLAEATAGK